MYVYSLPKIIYNLLTIYHILLNILNSLLTIHHILLTCFTPYFSHSLLSILSIFLTNFPAINISKCPDQILLGTLLKLQLTRIKEFQKVISSRNE